MTEPVAPGAGLHLQRIQPRVLRQEVLTALRTAILANEIASGSRLLEADIAEQMSVSRAPVREAIRHLEQEGLVEIFPHRGAVVVGLPEAEIDAIYELRSVIEGRATAAVVGVIGEAEVVRLEALIDDMRTAIKGREVETIAEVDLQFHGLIVEWSGLTLLRHIWSGLDGLVRVRSYQALDRPGSTARYFLKNAAGSHTVLVNALRAGDPEAAALLARQHVLEVPTMLAGLPRPGRTTPSSTSSSGRGRA
ncbi:MAG TPA: GntR family transcriptional regulator [Pleomorphomonadaceae bacterium]|nr:GntR family transcriptional regulator [Pleomorphomonadaceae bacterium]